MKTWLECYRDPLHTVYLDEHVERVVEGAHHRVRWMVVRGGYSLNAYVGVPLDSPAAGWGDELVPLDVHGGLTFSEAGASDPWPAGWWWYGWDYAHLGDRTWIYLEMAERGIVTPSSIAFPEHEWTIPMVAEEALEAAGQMLALLVSGWRPTDVAIAEQDERDRRLEEFRRDLADGTVEQRMANDIAKSRRLAQLDG